MRIQYKLSITFVLLLVFGVTAISSYSIVFIRGYLMDQAEQDMRTDARQILVSMQLGGDDATAIRPVLEAIAPGTLYDIRVFDTSSQLVDQSLRSANWADDETELRFEIPADITATGNSSVLPGSMAGSNRLFIYSRLVLPEEPSPYLVEVSRLKSEIYEPVRTIRWIIYSGMFISIAIILFVSFIFSNYLAKPILALTKASQRIAEGETSHTITLNRSDEFGTLALSLNRMAARLQEDNKRLVEANERQKQFYADIAHEIRNPLHTISGALEMLEFDSLPPEKKSKFLKSARNQAERMNRLFQDLMTLQRSDLDPNFIHMRPFWINEVIETLEQAYQQSASEKGLDFSVKGDDTRVLGDPGKIEQVLDNLISNAIKYTPEGAVRVEWYPTGGKLTISVSDTGIGIHPEHVPRLFDRFYRTDKARSRDQGGTGLGLAVVKSILDAHQSEVQIDSTSVSGTTISFKLPLVS